MASGRRATRRVGDRLTTALGSICLVATLLLSSPGVRVVHAGGEPRPSGPADAATAPPSPGEADEAAPAAKAVPAPAAGTADQPASPEAARSPEADEVIAIDNRGYNYGPPPADLGLSPRDLERLRAGGAGPDPRSRPAR